MKTIICDIDGTLTNLWPIEKIVLLQLLGYQLLPDIERLKQSGTSETYQMYKKISASYITKKDYREKYIAAFSALAEKNLLPDIEKYPLVGWVEEHSQYQFVYATGGQKQEAEYALQNLGLFAYFDIEHSVDKTRCRFSKKTGLPFKQILRTYPDCFLFTDSTADIEGAKRANIPFLLVRPGESVSLPF